MSLSRGIPVTPNMETNMIQMAIPGLALLLPVIMYQFSAMDQLHVRYQTAKRFSAEETFDFIVGE